MIKGLITLFLICVLLGGCSPPRPNSDRVSECEANGTCQQQR